ncbi:hypothetical protein [Streptomyces sp. NPDC003247]|uniref:hypothetical protein n=1 Tax=Streptomyces sp. NPDC003247 TaxID=3364677 RepID=UPI0036B34686
MYEDRYQYPRFRAAELIRSAERERLAREAVRGRRAARREAAEREREAAPRPWESAESAERPCGTAARAPDAAAPDGDGVFRVPDGAPPSARTP